MDIKDFIKVASVFGEETKKQVQLKEDEIDDALKDLLGIEDQETIDTIRDIADEAPDAQTDAPAQGNNDTSSQDSEAPGTGQDNGDDTGSGSDTRIPPVGVERLPPIDNDPEEFNLGVDDTDSADSGDTSTVGDDSDDDSTSVDDTDSADSGTPSTGGSLLGRKLDTTTPNLMKAYNDGGKQAMPEIRNLQTALSRLGFDPNGIDGKYGQGTFAAVQAFQRANGLQVDGQAGPNTMAAIKKALDDKFAASQNNTDDTDTAATAGPDDGTRAGQEPNAPQTDAENDAEPVPSRLRIRQVIAPEVEKLLAMANESIIAFRAILEGKGLAEALDPPQKAQLQKYLDQIRASAERDPEVNVEFGDLIRRIESALGIQNTVRQTGGDGPEEINPDDEAQDIANVKAIQQRQADAQAATEPQTDAEAPQTDAELDADSTDNSTPAAPRVSDERGMQSNGSIVNFNINQFKEKGTYIDLPDRNNPGFVVRVYGDRAALQNFIKNDRRGRGLTIQGGGATTGSGSPTPTDVQDRTRGTNSVQAGVPDAERDGRERGVQTASKDNNMKKAIKEASMNISMNGSNAAEVAELVGILKNAGMSDAAPVSDMPIYKDGHDDMVSKMRMMDEPMPCATCGGDHGDSPCGMGEEAVDEDWDNTPDESYADHQTMTKDLSGGLNRQKKAYAKAQDGDNAMAVESSIKEQLWAALNEKMATEGRGRGRGKNKKMKEVDIKTTEGRGKGKGRGRGKG